VQQFRDDRDAALDSYAQALERFNAIGDRLGQANVLKAIGDVQQFRDDRDAALDSYAQALERFNAIGSLLGQANVLQSQGKLYLQQNDPEAIQKGAEMFDRALALYQEIGARVGQTNVYAFLARWLAGRGQYSEALGYARQALELAMSFIPTHPFTKWLSEFTADLAEKAGAGTGN
jgi:tetratricopeptide (TPR) repeat protein